MSIVWIVPAIAYLARLSHRQLVLATPVDCPPPTNLSDLSFLTYLLFRLDLVGTVEVHRLIGLKV